MCSVRTLSFLATALIVMGAHAQPSGDIDGNGSVTPQDASLLAEHLTGSLTLDVDQLVRADCNGDPGVDCADIVWIINSVPLSSPEMISIPAGSFNMGDPWGEGESDELPVHTVTLSAYEIGRCEVTNAEFAAFLNSALVANEISVTSGVVHLPGNSIFPLFETYPDGSEFSQIVLSDGVFAVRSRDGHSMNDHPVVEVSWMGAAVYCNWLSRQQGHQEVYTESGDWESDLSRDGYHLPTEAQWERAAAWDPSHSGSINYPIPVDQSAFGHWRYGFTSDTINQSQANYSYESLRYSNPLGLTSPPYTSPVGHYSGSMSDAGCNGMSGNVSELCNDWYSSTYYDSSPQSDPEGPSPQHSRVVRGGAWLYRDHSCRSTLRDKFVPFGWYFVVGFRVSRNP
jgi:formylglycine-generating enzyme required for sulfatase activity